ncbi:MULTISPECIES: lipid-A-disaccharide synthase-related protein [Spirulina sp. CCY15215]|uniref:lipid-A-disaccharide synthase-related protein n=1 Tax=Spirulina sp. CCY15215 TaxID=2767591 RepID=UPI0019528F77|nr:lipid-A-disaccharide synthase-related protein [Spirulina major]
MKLLCLSNGHGEDSIAVRILEELRKLPNAPEIAALPLVGEGYAYTKADIPIIGPVKKMPSGGFIYMDGRQLWKDVRGGLLGLTCAQYRLVRRWHKRGGSVLAVGDIVPLLFAWLSGANYAFVGTAKSEYYLRDESGWLSRSHGWESWSGSVYLPWERWLMGRDRCKVIFPRDRLTTSVLKQFSLPAFALGNPMMDGILPDPPAPIFYEKDAEEQEKARPFKVLLLPGSRAPEAYNNWALILQAVANIQQEFPGRSLLFLAAIAPSLDLDEFQKGLTGWEEENSLPEDAPINDLSALVFRRDRAQLVLTQNAYNACLLSADFAIAMAGTATEQFVGLGKPVITFPGEGPQFNYQFAEAQTRLLGNSVILVKKPEETAKTIQGVLAKPDRLQLIAQNGVKRMGKPGAAARIAKCLLERINDQ